MATQGARFSIKNILPAFVIAIVALAVSFILSDFSVPRSAKIPAAASVADDVMSPRIIAVESFGVSTSSAVISWQTDELSDSFVEHGVSISFGLGPVFSETLTQSHELTITDLTPGTSYYYRIKSKDGAGNRAVSEEYRVRTLDRPADPDNSVLTVTRVLPGQFDDTKYTVSISDSDGLGYVHVETAEGDIIRANNLRYGFYGGIRACPAEPITTDTITLEPSDFPLTGYVIDCAHTGVKYPVTADMPPVTSNTFIKDLASLFEPFSQLLSGMVESAR